MALCFCTDVRVPRSSHPTLREKTNMLLPLKRLTCSFKDRNKGDDHQSCDVPLFPEEGGSVCVCVRTHCLQFVLNMLTYLFAQMLYTCGGLMLTSKGPN